MPVDASSATASIARRAPRRRLRALGTAALLALPATAAPQSPLVADLYPQHPTIVGFLPAALPVADEAADALARSLVAQALARAQACMAGPAVNYQLLVADHIVVHDGKRVTAFEITDAAPFAGALLLAPGANPRILFAGSGAQALADGLPQAAGDYFHRACAH